MNPKMPAIDESSNTANLSGFSWVEGAEKKMWAVINNPVDALLLPVARIILILFLTYVALRFTGKLIDRIFQLKRIDRKKALTLSKLIKSFARYAIYFVAALTLLFNIGIDPTPVLASAGILGLAIGFGAQNLVRDLISGFFIIFEDQMEVGDYVQITEKSRGPWRKSEFASPRSASGTNAFIICPTAKSTTWPTTTGCRCAPWYR